MKRSNKANIFIILGQKPVSQIKMTFQEIRIIATGPCIANQVSTKMLKIFFLSMCDVKVFLTFASLSLALI
jgi:hypothetical protein